MILTDRPGVSNIKIAVLTRLRRVLPVINAGANPHSIILIRPGTASTDRLIFHENVLFLLFRINCKDNPIDSMTCKKNLNQKPTASCPFQFHDMILSCRPQKGLTGPVFDPLPSGTERLWPCKPGHYYTRRVALCVSHDPYVGVTP